MPVSLAAIRTGIAILAGAPAGKPAAITLALAVALATGPFAAPNALARPEMAGQSAETRFNTMDANKDGTISREEFFAAQPNMKEGAFAAIDTDNDSALTISEWEAFAAGHGKDGAMGMPPMPPDAAGAPGAAPDAAGKSGPRAPALIMPPRGAK